jgi:acyl-CoA thioesterase FadM
VLGTRLPGPGAVYVSQTLYFRAPVNIGDTVDATVTVAELIPERQRTRLTCICRVGNEVVLEGEALVKVPSMAKSKRPLPIATGTLPKAEMREALGSQVQLLSLRSAHGSRATRV